MYFSEFNKIYYDFPDNSPSGRFIQVLTDITQNVRVRKNVLETITLYDEYDIQDGDTPEIIAEKYYDNPEYHWIIMLVNQRYDYINDFPLPMLELEKHIVNTYGIDHIDNIHHYERDGYFTEATGTLVVPSSIVNDFKVNDFISAMPTTIGTIQAINLATNSIEVDTSRGMFDIGMRCRIVRTNISVSLNNITYSGNIATIVLPPSIVQAISIGDTLESLSATNARVTNIIPASNQIVVKLSFGRFVGNGQMQCLVKGIRLNTATLNNEFIELPSLTFTIPQNGFALSDTYDIITNAMFEEAENEKKRRIKLISPTLIDQFINEFKVLM